ncbi:MAG: hypothetical protein PVG86_05675 [Desulfobacterales bacterium]|jgi:hypothetical protein
MAFEPHPSLKSDGGRKWVAKTLLVLVLALNIINDLLWVMLSCAPGGYISSVKRAAYVPPFRHADPEEKFKP